MVADDACAGWCVRRAGGGLMSHREELWRHRDGRHHSCIGGSWRSAQSLVIQVGVAAVWLPNEQQRAVHQLRHQMAIHSWCGRHAAQSTESSHPNYSIGESAWGKISRVLVRYFVYIGEIGNVQGNNKIGKIPRNYHTVSILNGIYAPPKEINPRHFMCTYGIQCTSTFIAPFTAP